jgi:hypothetical protein
MINMIGNIILEALQRVVCLQNNRKHFIISDMTNAVAMQCQYVLVRIAMLEGAQLCSTFLANRRQDATEQPELPAYITALT